MHELDWMDADLDEIDPLEYTTIAGTATISNIPALPAPVLGDDLTDVVTLQLGDDIAPVRLTMNVPEHIDRAEIRLGAGDAGSFALHLLHGFVPLWEQCAIAWLVEPVLLEHLPGGENSIELTAGTVDADVTLGSCTAAQQLSFPTVNVGFAGDGSSADFVVDQRFFRSPFWVLAVGNEIAEQLPPTADLVLRWRDAPSNIGVRLSSADSVRQPQCHL